MPRNPDRTNLCQFTYADGRRCTSPQFPDDMGFCYYHGEKCRASLKSSIAGRHISRFLHADVPTACDLNSTLAALFDATAQGLIKPKVAATLAYISSLMMQNHKLAKQEFLETHTSTWPEVVAHNPAFHAKRFWTQEAERAAELEALYYKRRSVPPVPFSDPQPPLPKSETAFPQRQLVPTGPDHSDSPIPNNARAASASNTLESQHMQTTQTNYL